MILHIVGRREWEEAVRCGRYAPESLGDEGFIHCSTRAQIVDTANRFYRGRRGLVILWIDQEKLEASVKFEAPKSAHAELAHDARADERFPHLYGPLNLDAVVEVIEFPCGADGSFRLPARLGDGN